MDLTQNFYLIALILGCVEGLTEFIPVSSTGHLIVVAHALSFTGKKAETFEIFIQFGAILAVVQLYNRDLLRHWLKISLSCVPACLIGFLFRKIIKTYLWSPPSVAMALIFGGLVMLLAERRIKTDSKQSLDEISMRDAFILGLFQMASLWPGISRAGSMMVGGLFLGFSRRLASEYSFIVAAPILTLACFYDLFKSVREGVLDLGDLPLFALGSVVSFVTAWLAIKGFLYLLRSYTLRPFAYYRIVIGCGVLLYFFFV